MDLVLGVDAGGTRTRAWLADRDGTVLGRGESGPGNCHVLGIEGASRAMAEAVEAARAAAGLASPPSGYAAVLAGVAGAGTTGVQEVLGGALALILGVEPARCRVDHDMRVALAGAIPGGAGMVVIAGTGSVGYGRDAGGREWRAGGWGPALDDGGGGCWLGLEALRALVRAADGRSPATTLTESLHARMGSSAAREALRWTGELAVNRERIAALAPLVLAAAGAGDPIAAEIVARGVEELATLATTVAGRMASGGCIVRQLAACGGLLRKGSDYRGMLETSLAVRLPGVAVTEPVLAPVAGAVLLALEMLGGAVDEKVVARLAGAGGQAEP